MSTINEKALIELVRTAMGAGVACFMDRVRAGQVDMSAPLHEAFGDFPEKFLQIRRYLVDDLLCTCLPPGGASYDSYESPQRDCLVHGEES